MGWSRGISAQGRGVGRAGWDGEGGSFFLYVLYRERVCVYLSLVFDFDGMGRGEVGKGGSGPPGPIHPVHFSFFIFEKVVCWVQISSPLAMLLQKQFRQSMLYANQIKPGPTLHPLSPPIPSALQMEL